MGPRNGDTDGFAQHSPPDDLDQTRDFGPADPEPILEDQFDQNWGA
jgi:hypothetical protein